MKPGKLKVGCLAWVIRARTLENLGKVVRVLSLLQTVPGQLYMLPTGRTVCSLEGGLVAVVESQSGPLAFAATGSPWEKRIARSPVYSIRASGLLPFPEEGDECDEAAQSTTIKEST